MKIIKILPIEPNAIDASFIVSFFIIKLRWTTVNNSIRIKQALYDKSITKFTYNI